MAASTQLAEATRPRTERLTAVEPSYGDLLADAVSSGITVWGGGFALVLMLLGAMLWGLGAQREVDSAVVAGKIVLWSGVGLLVLVALRVLLYLISYRTVLTMDRELLAYFSSPIAYAVIAGVLVIDTINFWDLVSQLRNLQVQMVGEMSPVVSFVAWNLWFWLALLFIIPAITMRLVAEERRQGTIEVLLTAPVREVEVVVGKFLAALVFYTALNVPSLLFLLRLRFSADYEFELWPVLATYLGVLSIGAMFIAVGLFSSALTRNQIVAAMSTFAILLALFSTFVFYYYAQASVTFADYADLLKHIAVLPHLADLGQGRVNPTYFVYHLSVTGFMLYASVKVLELRRAA